ncbi:MAG TPA: WecB/TagA/CpsF family glycosyltransferase [Opitutaceae bacterium]|nr:WecB/TagA/CpsF family glycosyltransferase [Opitutaceae bacterium]
MQAIPRYNVLGTGISALNLATARAAVLAALAARQQGYVCTADLRVVNLAAEDAAFRAQLNASLLTTPDGMPLVWLGRRSGHRAVGRVYGPDLMRAVCAATVATGYTHYFYGGAPGVAAELRRRLETRFPGLRVVGVRSPPFRTLTAGEEADLCADVAAVKPDLFWVALGVPAREQFMAGHLGRLDTTLMLGVGAAFDLLAGRVRQAPRWIQRSGGEWLFRLCLEPRRLAPRYLRHLPLFALRAAAQFTGLRQYP